MVTPSRASRRAEAQRGLARRADGTMTDVPGRPGRGEGRRAKGGERRHEPRGSRKGSWRQELQPAQLRAGRHLGVRTP